jgi:hypothetical protein
MVYVTDGTLGVDLELLTAGTGTSFNQGGLFEVGHTVIANDGSAWMYVHAAGVIDIYDAVGIDEAFEAQALTKAMADDGWTIGFAQVAFADNDFGWVALRGTKNLQVNLLGLCAADVSLYTSGTAGHLDDSSTSQTKIDGVVNVTVVATAASASTVIASWPRPSTF